LLRNVPSDVDRTNVSIFPAVHSTARLGHDSPVGLQTSDRSRLRPALGFVQLAGAGRFDPHERKLSRRSVGQGDSHWTASAAQPELKRRRRRI
jgi:hypothetical protein